MKELTRLQQLSEAGAGHVLTPMAKASHDRRRKWCDQMETQINSVSRVVHGGVLKNILENGKFPATESKAMQKAFDKFVSEFEDLKMALLQEFDLQEAMGMSDEVAAKKLFKKIQGQPNLKMVHVKAFIMQNLGLVGKAKTDVDHLTALVWSELEDKDLV